MKKVIKNILLWGVPTILCAVLVIGIAVYSIFYEKPKTIEPYVEIMSEFGYNHHDYIVFEVTDSLNNKYVSIVHSPDCWCMEHKKEIKNDNKRTKRETGKQKS